MEKNSTTRIFIKIFKEKYFFQEQQEMKNILFENSKL